MRKDNSEPESSKELAYISDPSMLIYIEDIFMGAEIKLSRVPVPQMAMMVPG